ncbi:MAG: MarR family transcriptional regulator [Pseudomonadota bacterium]
MSAIVEAADKPNLKQQVTYPLARLNARLTAQAARLLRKRSELSLVEWRVLVIVDSRGEASMAEIIRFLDVDKGQMSRVSHRLVRSGLLQSVPSKSDQRVHLLSLTAAGKAAFSRAAPHMRRRREFLLAALSSEEQAQFFHIMSKLGEAIDAFEDRL